MGTSITKYAYSVSGAHLSEKYFFSGNDMNKLISATSYEAVIAALSEKGWIIPEDSRDINKLLSNELCRAWDWIIASVPNPELFDALILKNDYHNLKAGIKSLLSNYEIDMHFVSPCTIKHSAMKEAVESGEYDLLPAPFNKLGKETYDLLVRTEDGQAADIMIDRMCLEELIKAANESKIELLAKEIEIYVAFSNIKTAYRAIKTGKSADFLEQALAEGCTTVDKTKIIACLNYGNKNNNNISDNNNIYSYSNNTNREASSSTQATTIQNSTTQGTAASKDAMEDAMERLIDYLSATPYAEGIKFLSSTPADFEKWTDDLMLSLVVPYRFNPLGPEPIIGFFLGKEAEIKNIRIILAAKQNNLPPEMISDRLRRLYE